MNRLLRLTLLLGIPLLLVATGGLIYKDWFAFHEPTDPRLELLLIAQQDTYTMNYGGMSPADYRHIVTSTQGTPELYCKRPTSSPVDFRLEIRNKSDENVEFWLENDFPMQYLTLTLQGNGAVLLVYDYGVFRRGYPKPSEHVSLKAGETYTQSITILKTMVTRVTANEWYWTKPGVYNLTAAVQLASSPGSEQSSSRQEPVLRSPPVQFKVLDAEPTP